MTAELLIVVDGKTIPLATVTSELALLEIINSLTAWPRRNQVSVAPTLRAAMYVARTRGSASPMTDAIRLAGDRV